MTAKEALVGQMAKPAFAALHFSGDWLVIAAMLALAAAVAFLVAALLRRRARMRALAESEERFRTLAQFTTAGILLYQGDDIVYANRAAAEITGYSELEMRAMRFWDLVHPEDREMVKQRGLARQAGEMLPSHTEFKITRKDGEERFVDVSAGLVKYRGRPAGLITAYDVTERKKTEEALRQSEERLRLILDHVHDVIYYNALEGDPPRLVPKFVNPEVEEVFGYPPSVFLEGGSGLWFECIHPDDRERIMNMPPIFRASTGPRTIVYRFRNGLTGEYHWVEDTAVPQAGQDGGVKGFFGVARDISKRKKAEEALRKSERDYRGLFEGAHDAILVISADLGRVLDANAQACTLYGYPHDEVVGMPIAMLGVEEAECRKHLGPVMEQGFARDCQMTHKRRDGKFLSVEINAAAVEYQGKQAVLSIIRDVTEKKRAEQQIVRRNKQLQALLSSSQAMTGFLDLQKTLGAICQAAVEAFDLKMAWVGKVVPESTELIFVASAGIDNGYAQKVRARWDESPLGLGPLGRCVRTRKPATARLSDASFSPWRAEAEARGYESICALPLLHEDTIRGSFNVYSTHPNAFGPDTIEVLEIFARQCAMVLVNASLYDEAKRYIEELLRSGQQAASSSKDPDGV